MAKHSKNATARGDFTYAERQRLTGYGTQKQRLGKDSLRAWDSCCLCLGALAEPMACPKGHLYCKECIYDCVLAQKKDGERKVREWDKQCLADAQAAAAKADADRQAELRAFERTEAGLGASNSSSSSAGFKNSQAMAELKPQFLLDAGIDSYTFPDGRTIRFDVEYRDLADRELLFKALQAARMEYENKREVPSFWTTHLTPLHEVRAEKPDTTPQCPEGGHPLRLKQLVRVTLYRADQAAAAAGAAASGDYQHQCPACRSLLTNATRVKVLRSCGHALCAKCVTMNAKGDSASSCPMCSTKFRPTDVIAVASGGTGFTSHGEAVVAKMYVPTAQV